VPGLPLGAAVSAPGRVLGRVRDLFERDLPEHSATERLAGAAFAAAVLWLAIFGRYHERLAR
jgi:hypothetical protein